jgi:hypothetical protein
MFSPYRALGIVCSDVAPVMNSLGKDTFVTVSIDRSFVVYAADNLATRMVTPPLGKSIKCVLLLRAWGAVAAARAGSYTHMARTTPPLSLRSTCCSVPHMRSSEWQRLYRRRRGCPPRGLTCHSATVLRTETAAAWCPGHADRFVHTLPW